MIFNIYSGLERERVTWIFLQTKCVTKNAFTTGGGTIIWWISWNFLVYNSPDEHPRISEAERDYINSTIAQRSGTQNRQVGLHKENMNTTVSIRQICNAPFE